MTPSKTGSQSVKSTRARAKPTLQQLRSRYGSEAADAALIAAERYQARDSIAYALTSLEEKFGPFDAPPQQNGEGVRAPQKLPCDCHGVPCWMDDLVVRAGWAVCSLTMRVFGPAEFETDELKSPVARKVKTYWAKVLA